MRSRLERLAICVSQFLNVLILNGHEDVSISGRVGYKAYKTKKKKWLIAERVINFITFDPNHCYKSIEWPHVDKY